MIRQSAKTGRYYCDGHECGYPLAWTPPDPEEPWDGCGLWVCLDCNASMAAMPEKKGPLQ